MQTHIIAMAAAFIIATGPGAFAQSSKAAPITVIVDGLRNNDGAVIVAAFDQADSFEAMDVDKAVAMAYLPAANRSVSVTFHDLPDGTYAFAALHDEDRNGDLNMKGDVPAEGYAFAAMGRSGLPSKLSDAAVVTGKDTQSTLHLKYWM